MSDFKIGDRVVLRSCRYGSPLLYAKPGTKFFVVYSVRPDQCYVGVEGTGHEYADWVSKDILVKYGEPEEKESATITVTLDRATALAITTSYLPDGMRRKSKGPLEVGVRKKWVQAIHVALEGPEITQARRLLESKGYAVERK